MNGPEWAFDGHGRLRDIGSGIKINTYGPPEPIRWVSVDDLPTILGQPVADCGRDDTLYDLRAATEVYEQGGSRWVNLVADAQWWQWIDTPDRVRPERCPRAIARRSVHVWAEVRTGEKQVNPDE